MVVGLAPPQVPQVPVEPPVDGQVVGGVVPQVTLEGAVVAMIVDRNDDGEGNQLQNNIMRACIHTHMHT